MFGVDVLTQPQIDAIVLDFPIFPAVWNGGAQSRDFGSENAKNLVDGKNYLSKAIFRKRCKTVGKLVLITNRKSHMNFRLVSKSVTLNDLERHNAVILRYFSEFDSFRGTLRKSG